MGIFAALRAWFGGKPSVSVMSLETMTSISDPIAESVAVSIAPEPAKTEEVPVAEFNYSPAPSAAEFPARPGLASEVAEVHDIAPVTSSTPTVEVVQSITTTEVAVHTDAPAAESTTTTVDIPKPVVKPRTKPKSRATRTRRSTRAKRPV